LVTIAMVVFWFGIQLNTIYIQFAPRCSVEVVVLEGLAALAEGGVLALVGAQQGLVRVTSPGQ